MIWSSARCCPSPKLFADDTTLPVLDPGRGRTKKGRLWCYAVDDRPWCGTAIRRRPTCIPRIARARAPPGTWRSSTACCRLTAMTASSGWPEIVPTHSVRLAFCWAHMRRPLLRLPCLHQVAACGRGAGTHPRALCDRGGDPRPSRRAPTTRAARTKSTDRGGSARLVAASYRPCLGASDLAKAIRYAIRHWPGLIVFLDDGRVEMDTNVVERAIRPIPLTRKNALFAGSDGGARHWAIAMTLIQTAKLNGVDPMAWLTDVLERVVSGRTKAHELHTLLPWNWRDPSSFDSALAA